MNLQQLNNFKFQFITHYNDKYDYIDSAKIAIEGGCRWIQLRMKDASLDDLRKNALILKELCVQAGATFIIDDQVELCKEICKYQGVNFYEKNVMFIFSINSCSRHLL